MFCKQYRSIQHLSLLLFNILVKYYDVFIIVIQSKTYTSILECFLLYKHLVHPSVILLNMYFVRLQYLLHSCEQLTYILEDILTGYLSLSHKKIWPFISQKSQISILLKALKFIGYFRLTQNYEICQLATIGSISLRKNISRGSG